MRKAKWKIIKMNGMLNFQKNNTLSSLAKILTQSEWFFQVSHSLLWRPAAACAESSLSVRQPVFVYSPRIQAGPFLTFRATDRAVLSWLVARKNLGDLAGTRWEAWCNTRLHQNRGILQRRMSKMPPFVWFSIGAQTEAPDGNQILLCKLGVSTVYGLFWHCAPRYFLAGKPISILFLFRCEYLGTWSRFWPSAHMAVVSGECLTN